MPPKPVVARGSGSVGVNVRSSAIFLPPSFTSQGNATLEDVIAHGGLEQWSLYPSLSAAAGNCQTL